MSCPVPLRNCACRATPLALETGLRQAALRGDVVDVGLRLQPLGVLDHRPGYRHTAARTRHVVCPIFSR